MKTIPHSLSAERLRFLLDYNPSTGIFIRLTTATAWRPAGITSGCTRKDGNVILSVDNKKYSAHRLAWLYVYGHWPHEVIDHIDGNRQNNAIFNLRDVSQRTNTENVRKPRPNNKSGFLGVSVTPEGRFLSVITVLRKGVRLGVYDTPEKAHRVYLDAKRQLHVGCTI